MPLPSFQNYIFNEDQIKLSEEQLLKLQLLIETYQSRYARLVAGPLKTMRETVERDNLRTQIAETQLQIDQLKRKIRELEK